MRSSLGHLLHGRIDIQVPQEKLCQESGSNIEEYFALNTEEKDSIELLKVLLFQW